MVSLLVIFTRRRTEAAHAAANIPRDMRKFSLFVPSPNELAMVAAERDIWPRRFSIKQPPESADLPVIYSTYLRRHLVQRDEVDFFRSLAMTASLGEWESFKDILGMRINLPVESLNPDRVLKWAKAEKCSSYGQEIAFRLVQWDPTKLAAVKDIFTSCNPQSFFSLWFEILTHIEKGSQAELESLREKLQARRLTLSNDTFEYFLVTQAFEVVDMKLIHE